MWNREHLGLSGRKKIGMPRDSITLDAESQHCFGSSDSGIQSG